MIESPPLSARVATWLLDRDGITGGLLGLLLVSLWTCFISTLLAIYGDLDAMVPWAVGGGLLAVAIVASIGGLLAVEWRARDDLRGVDDDVRLDGDRGARAFAGLPTSLQMSYRHLLLDLRASVLASARDPENPYLASRVRERADALDAALDASRRLEDAVLGTEGLGASESLRRILDEVTGDVRSRDSR